MFISLSLVLFSVLLKLWLLSCVILDLSHNKFRNYPFFFFLFAERGNCSSGNALRISDSVDRLCCYWCCGSVIFVLILLVKKSRHIQSYKLTQNMYILAIIHWGSLICMENCKFLCVMCVFLNLYLCQGFS